MKSFKLFREAKNLIKRLKDGNVSNLQIDIKEN